MPKKKTSKATKTVEKPKAEVTLLKNGYVHGELRRAGETVEVNPELRAYLVRTSPEVYQ